MMFFNWILYIGEGGRDGYFSFRAKMKSYDTALVHLIIKKEKQEELIMEIK